jgi:hypothetical protein
MFRMSKLNEYGWAVKPSMPGHWHGTTSTGEFEIIITAAGIEARAEADSNQEAQRERAAAVVENLVRAIGLREHERYTTRFASLSQFNPATNSRSVNVHPEGVPAKASVGYTYDRPTRPLESIS